MTLGKRLYWLAGLVAVIALAFAAVTLASTSGSAQTTPPVATDNADGETNDGANGDTDNVDHQADGETADDPAGTADTKTTDDNGSASGAGKLDDGKDLLPQASITIDQAITAAKTAATGNIGEIDLEDYNGKLAFNVDVGGSDVKVDASIGAVLGSGSD